MLVIHIPLFPLCDYVYIVSLVFVSILYYPHPLLMCAIALNEYPQRQRALVHDSDLSRETASASRHALSSVLLESVYVLSCLRFVVMCLSITCVLD